MEFEDEEYCTPYAEPQSVEHQALHLPQVRGCFGCDRGKALHQYKRRSKGAVLGLTGPDTTLRPFGALVHIDWNENAAVFELKDSLDTVLVLDVDDAVIDDEVVKEAEAAAVERVSVDSGRMRRFSVMLWLKRCWLLQGEHLRPGGVLIASRMARAGCAL